MVLLDITQDIKDGRYPPPIFNNRNHKVFGRRIFVLIDGVILVGNIQYMYNDDRDSIIIYVNFNWRMQSDNVDNSKKMIIKKYIVPEGVDIDLFMKRIRKEIIAEPQLKGTKWSFNAESLV